MTIHTLVRGSALMALAALVMPAIASAQVNTPIGGIATVNAGAAIYKSKAWTTAQAPNGILTATYKVQLDQIAAKRQQREAALLTLDKNGDKQIDDAEQQAAIAANSPVIAQVTGLDRDIQALNQPLAVAQAYVLDTIANRYETALQTIVRDKKISIVLAPNAVAFAPPNTDITQAVITEIDRILPSVSVTPPANWQVTDQGGQLYDQWQTLVQQQLQQQALASQQQPGVAPAARPAGTASPARPVTQQPARR